MKKFLAILLIAISTATAYADVDRLAAYDVSSGKFVATSINYTAGTTSEVISTVGKNLIFQTQPGNAIVLQKSANDTLGYVLNVTAVGGNDHATIRSQTTGTVANANVASFRAVVKQGSMALNYTAYDVGVEYTGSKTSVTGLDYSHDKAISTGTTQTIIRSLIGYSTPSEVDGTLYGTYMDVETSTASSGNVYAGYYDITARGSSNANGFKILCSSTGGSANGIEIITTAGDASAIDTQVSCSLASARPTNMSLSTSMVAGVYGVVGAIGSYNSVTYIGNDSKTTSYYSSVGSFIDHDIAWVSAGSSNKLNAGVVVDATLGNSTSIDYYSYYTVQDKALGATGTGVGQGFYYGKVNGFITGGTGDFYGLYFDMHSLNITGGGEMEGAHIYMPLHKSSSGIAIRNTWSEDAVTLRGGDGVKLDGGFTRGINMGPYQSANSMVVEYQYDSLTDIVGKVVCAYAGASSDVKLADKDSGNSIPLGIVTYQEKSGVGVISKVWVAISGTASVDPAYITGETVGDALYVADDGLLTDTPPGAGDYIYPVGVVVSITADEVRIQLMLTAYTYSIGA